MLDFGRKEKMLQEKMQDRGSTSKEKWKLERVKKTYNAISLIE
jgi:hypothetical protein